MVTDEVVKGEQKRGGRGNVREANKRKHDHTEDCNTEDMITVYSVIDWRYSEYSELLWISYYG